MTIKKKPLMAVSVFSAVVVAMILIFYGMERHVHQGDIKIIPEHADIQVEDVVFKDVAETGVKWEVRAAKGLYGRKADEALFEQVEVRLLMPNGRTFVMNGDRGTFKTGTRDMIISGHVVVLFDSGDRITMDNLTYRARERILATDSSVTMENERIKVSGKGMRIYMDSRELRLLANVSAVVKTP